MFYAKSYNKAVCGYNFDLVSFENKKQRDNFVKAGYGFQAVTAKEAAEHEAFRFVKSNPFTVIDSLKKCQGVIIFNIYDEVHEYL